MALVLDARDLNKHFGAITAAMNINAAIEQDSVVGLIGTNGAGKTTFINMITGYIKPDTGSIVFQGQRHHGAVAARRSRASASADRFRSRSSTHRSACSST